MVYEQEGTYLWSLYSEVGGNERIKFRWVTLWDDDPGRLFCPFRMGFLTKIIGTDVLMNLVVEVVMVAAVDVVQAGFFIFF